MSFDPNEFDRSYAGNYVEPLGQYTAKTFLWVMLGRLAGMLAALLACGLTAYQAAACAVYLHGAAADRAAAKHGEYGMLPHDILPELGALFAENQR